MRRSIPLLLLVLMACLWPAAVALAAGDDDVPGTPLTIGSSVSQTVDSDDVVDVYAVTMTEGQEVYIRLDPGNTAGNAGRIHVLVPGASSIAASDLYDEITYEAIGGTPKVDKHGAYFYYMPARSGVYYLCVEWTQGTLSYNLSVARTSRAALSLAADADGVPGTAIGPGTVTGVVSTRTDLYDVYAVTLTAGQQATMQLAPLTPYENYHPATARVSLLKPGTTSLDTAGAVAAGPVEAVAASVAADRKTATLQFTPAANGTYYVVVQAGPFAEPNYGMNFAYQLTTSGNGAASGGGGSGGSGGSGAFSDVAGSPYSTAIYDLAARGVITGFDDGTFRPNAPVTRQQFAKMIVKTLGYTVTGSEVCPFTDVAAQSGSDPLYPSKYVAVCALRGITSGKTATTFDPSSTITHQQLITMVARAAGLDEPPAGYAPAFTAAQFSLADHYNNARRAAYAGLLDGLQGMGAGYPFGGASTRGECAQVLQNLLGT
jgi:hypothetical protein